MNLSEVPAGKSLTPLNPACTFADVDDRPNPDGTTTEGWCSRVRRETSGQPLRAGPFDLSIQAKNLYTGIYQPLMLPGGGTQFATAVDREFALAAILKV